MKSENRMPVFFVGHGSPLNAIEKNWITDGWRSISSKLPEPKAILCISAHWFIDDLQVLNTEIPRTIHDFYGFPQEMYRFEYHAPGSTTLSKTIYRLIKSKSANFDDTWGLDHGCWVPLSIIFPDANIPVVQLSIDYRLSIEEHYQLGSELKSLRDEGVLIIGSGNIVHNLSKIDWLTPDSGASWAVEFNEISRELILARDDDRLIDYRTLGETAALSIPTSDHYLPLLYVLGASERTEPVTIINDGCVFGSVSMTSALIG